MRSGSRACGAAPAAALALACLLALSVSGARAESGIHQAHQRPASELASLVGFAMRAEAPALTADEKTNQILITGPAAAVTRARGLLGELDRAPAPVHVEIALEAAPPPAPPVWRARVAILSGLTARVELGGTPAALPSGAPLSWLKGRFTATSVAGAWDVRAHLDLGIAAATPRSFRLSGQSRAPASAWQDLAEAQVAPGETLKLRVRCVAP